MITWKYCQVMQQDRRFLQIKPFCNQYVSFDESILQTNNCLLKKYYCLLNPRKIWKKCGSSILVIGLSNRPSHEVDIFPISLYQSEKPFVYGEFSFFKSVWMIALKKPCRASCVGVQVCEEFVFPQFFSWGYMVNHIESCHYILW